MADVNHAEQPVGWYPGMKLVDQDGWETYTCPVDDCFWSHRVAPLPPQLNEGTLGAIFGLGSVMTSALNDRLQKIEEELRLHLRSHELAEFVGTIMRLRKEAYDRD